MIEFLASLKYYAGSWQRAKVYAQICGFYQIDESFQGLRSSTTSDLKLPKRMNDGKLNEMEEPYFDLYLQEYYLHCYSLISKERSKYQESKEGYTYIPNSVENTIASKVLIFMSTSEH